jgi:hypothetical protein
VVYFGGFFAKLGYFAGFSPHIFIKTIKKRKKEKEKHKVIKLRALVSKGHKNTNAPLILENLRYYFFWFWANNIMGHFKGYFEGASTFLTPKLPAQKKLISRIFKISGALIVILYVQRTVWDVPKGFGRRLAQHFGWFFIK